MSIGKSHAKVFVEKETKVTFNDVAVRALVDQALECAMSILQTNRALLDQTAEELLKTETLNQPEIIKLKQMITFSMSRRSQMNITVQ